LKRGRKKREQKSEQQNTCEDQNKNTHLTSKLGKKFFSVAKHDECKRKTIMNIDLLSNNSMQPRRVRQANQEKVNMEKPHKAS
jgi:hypothetical protein